MPFTTEQIVEELERELGMRQHVYSYAVRQRKMSQATMDERMGIVRQVIADYQAKLHPAEPKTEQEDLFGESDRTPRAWRQ